MNHYTMLYKYGEHMRYFRGHFYFNKTIIPLVCVGYEMRPSQVTVSAFVTQCNTVQDQLPLIAQCPVSQYTNLV